MIMLLILERSGDCTVLFTRLKQAGAPISANDWWIACHALVEGATLVRHNTGEYKRMAWVPVVDWVI